MFLLGARNHTRTHDNIKYFNSLYMCFDNLSQPSTEVV